MGKSEAFQNFLDSVDPGYKPPARQTCNRLLVALQRVFTRITTAKFDELRPLRLKKWISFQLDLWSSGLSKEAYGALTATFVEVSRVYALSHPSRGRAKTMMPKTIMPPMMMS